MIQFNLVCTDSASSFSLYFVKQTHLQYKRKQPFRFRSRKEVFQPLDHLYLLRRELLLKRKYLFLINSHIGSKLRIVQHSEFGLFIYRVSGFSKVVQGGRIPVFGKSGAAGAHSSMWLSRTAREGRKAPHSDGFR